jgi:hypothetical protein
MRKCYIAKYPLNKNGNDLDEIILLQNTHLTDEINHLWDDLIKNRNKNDPMIQIWYSDENQVICMATTNQPYKLD